MSPFGSTAVPGSPAHACEMLSAFDQQQGSPFLCHLELIWDSLSIQKENIFLCHNTVWYLKPHKGHSIVTKMKTLHSVPV